MSPPAHKATGPRRLGACLPEALRAALTRRSDESVRLAAAWRARVAEPLASRARPVRYEAGILHVHADAPVWISRLRHQQSALLGALRQEPELAGLAQIRARVVPPESAPDAAPPAPAPTRLSAKAAEAIARTAATIAHPGLRGALERLAAGAAPRRPR